MASVSTDLKGNRKLLFTGLRGKRESVWLGQVPKKLAIEVKDRIESLVTSLKYNRPLEHHVIEWMDKLDPRIYAKLLNTGLVSPREEIKTVHLGQFIDEYHAKRTDWKPNSVKNHKATRRWLLKYFDANQDVREINEGDAEDFRLFLGEHLGENTLRRICGMARQYFRAMKRRGLVKENPFESMKNIAVQGNRDRFYFVAPDIAIKVLDACPDAEWKLIFGLCRYGGFRCPSEHNALKWSDIDWKKGKINLDSPKTGLRTLPLFSELVPLLKAMPRTGKLVFPNFHHNVNLRTQFLKILEKAKIKPWPKIFQNLRSTRETELMEKFPPHVVCEWIGNTVSVATKHYLQVTDDHFKTALSHNLTQVGTESTENEGTLRNIGNITFLENVEKLSRFIEELPKIYIKKENGDYTRQESNKRKNTAKSDVSKKVVADFDADLEAILGF